MRAVRPKVSGHPRNARGDLELAHFSLGELFNRIQVRRDLGALARDADIELNVSRPPYFTCPGLLFTESRLKETVWLQTRFHPIILSTRYTQPPT